jgi:hypothetical protein
MANIFDELRQKVSIEEVASCLGYKVNPKAGTRGAYLEMQLFGGGDKKIDTIVIRKGRNGNTDSYFHRSTGTGGSVIDFVRENSCGLGGRSGNKWKDVFDAFSRFTSLPREAFHLEETARQWEQGRAPESFDLSRFEVKPITEDPDTAGLIFGQRALSEDTVRTFSPWIDLIRDTHSAYTHPCLGFPYREPGTDQIVGLELRGYGTFKGKASGTNSTTAAWIVDMSDGHYPPDVRNIYFAESAYDMMAFWQQNRLALKPESSVFVSVGGQLSSRQISGLMNYYPKANIVDCFDNDVYGRIYGIRTAAIVSDIHLQVVKCNDCARFNANGKCFSIPLNQVSTTAFCKEIPVSSRYRQHTAPKNFKDWNDVVMGLPEKEKVTPSKHQRDEKLEHYRLSGIRR